MSAATPKHYIDQNADDTLEALSTSTMQTQNGGVTSIQAEFIGTK